MASFWMQIVGTKDTGKTSVIEALTRELTRRGRSVVYIKHTHVEPTLEAEDTDTVRIRDAGARATVLAGTESTVVFRAGKPCGVAGLSFTEAAPGEIVLAEGYKATPGPKLVMSDSDLDIGSLENVVGVVGGSPTGFSGAAFDAEDVGPLCDLIEKLAESASEQQWATRLFIDGEEVPINAFVQDVVAGAVAGMTTVLRDVGDGEIYELKFRRVRRKD